MSFTIAMTVSMASKVTIVMTVSMASKVMIAKTVTIAITRGFARLG